MKGGEALWLSGRALDKREGGPTSAVLLGVGSKPTSTVMLGGGVEAYLRRVVS